jgi:UDP-glucose 4-epimerase
MKILVTGASGFIAGYLIADLLDAGHEVVGLDNFSKYGRVEKSYDRNPRYRLVEGDAKNAELMKSLLMDCDHFVACAAMIGGISYFHAFAYDLLAENERITAASFDAAIHAYKNAKLQKVTVLSSSMVFESTDQFPTPESAFGLPAATFDVWFPKARDRVLCQRSIRAIRAALHDCPAV